LNKNKSIIIPPKRPETQLWYFDILAKNRNKLQKYLFKNKIIVIPFHKPLHTITPYRRKEKFPISNKISSTGLYLPSHVNLTMGQIEYICAKINSFYKHS